MEQAGARRSPRRRPAATGPWRRRRGSEIRRHLRRGPRRLLTVGSPGPLPCQQNPQPRAETATRSKGPLPRSANPRTSFREQPRRSAPIRQSASSAGQRLRALRRADGRRQPRWIAELVLAPDNGRVGDKCDRVALGTCPSTPLRPAARAMWRRNSSAAPGDYQEWVLNSGDPSRRGQDRVIRQRRTQGRRRRAPRRRKDRPRARKGSSG